jgi:hypothetical protein
MFWPARANTPAVRANANAAVQVDSGANGGQKSGRSEMECYFFIPDSR